MCFTYVHMLFQKSGTFSLPPFFEDGCRRLGTGGQGGWECGVGKRRCEPHRWDKITYFCEDKQIRRGVEGERVISFFSLFVWVLLCEDA